MEILVNGEDKTIDMICKDIEKGEEIENSYIADYLEDNNIKYSYEGYYMTKEEYNEMIEFWESEIEHYENGYSEFLGDYKRNITYYLQER